MLTTQLTPTQVMQETPCGRWRKYSYEKVTWHYKVLICNPTDQWPSTKLCPLKTYIQQQPPPDCLTGVLAFILTFGLSLAAVAGPIRFFISAAIVTNACSTLVALFALVSRNGMRSWSAYSYNNQHCKLSSFVTSQTVLNYNFVKCTAG